MNKPHVFVRIQVLDFPSEHDREVRVELAQPLVRDALQVLDLPKEGAGLANLFCTDYATIERVTTTRKNAAELISKALTKAIVDAMGLHDKRMGYPK